MPHRYAGKTVAEILAEKRASIKNAPLDKGGPSWGDILDLTWEEVNLRAKKRLPGYMTIRKLLGKREYDR